MEKLPVSQLNGLSALYIVRKEAYERWHVKRCWIEVAYACNTESGCKVTTCRGSAELKPE